MSVVGVDLGTLNTVIAVARNRGVDVITNEVSNRATPSLVGFGPEARYTGEGAKNQEISNLKNTVSSLKRLVGRSLSDPDVQIEQNFVSARLVQCNGLALAKDVEEEYTNEKGEKAIRIVREPFEIPYKTEVGTEVTYRGKKTPFAATQLLAMFLSKIKETAHLELKLPVSDIVVSVPPWFTDGQRRSMLDAAEVAGLKILRLMNDTTAAALGYGITKLDLPAADEKPRRVAFIDIGHSNYSASIVEFKKGELAVKATAYDRHFGGREFNMALVRHFQKEFLAKHKIDIFTNPKALSRVEAGAEKLKKILSANQQAPLNIESLMNDVDVHEMVNREQFEKLIAPLLNRVTVPLEQALADAKLTKDDIEFIELVGGSSRVPAIKAEIQAFFGKPLSFTLNQDEAIARGSAFSCAILSPVFKVRDFSVQDIVNYPIKFSWEKDDDIPDEDTSLTVFNKGNVLPSTKILTFYRKQDFTLTAEYACDSKDLPGGTSKTIGKFSVKGVKAGPKSEFMICKLKARVNIHGILNVESGYYVEDEEVEEEIKEDGEKKDPDAMETDDKKDESKPRTRKVKKQVRKGDLEIVAETESIDAKTRTSATVYEKLMISDDVLVARTEDEMNKLEGRIYELLSKLDEEWAHDEAFDPRLFNRDNPDPKLVVAEKEKLGKILEDRKNWLFAEGGYENRPEPTLAQYQSSLIDINNIGRILERRYRETAEEKSNAAKGVQKAAEVNKDEEMTDAEAPKPEVEEPQVVG
ncbi:Uu.00g023560.m01.CDS01 [Anthostomella pinea]|uniref:Uu.00g023560.m01.CDS01 n=1 Tax=Anthostomella pinea TaxID=933095 RepID=A0AAI8YNY9_9PEZI|nr:Uu.00g023560.m01.CDS01 [Anthostomella pinea]